MAVKHLVENVRDIALVGHRAAGKTSLADALLYEAHAVDRLGSVDEGTSVSDCDDEEHKHHFSIDTARPPRRSRRQTPQHPRRPRLPRLHRRRSGGPCSRRDGRGRGLGRERRRGEHPPYVRRGRPSRPVAGVIVINKLDAEKTVDFPGVVTEIRAAFGKNCVLFNVPDAVGPAFKQVYLLARPGRADVPGSCPVDVAAARSQLIDAVVEVRRGSAGKIPVRRARDGGGTGGRHHPRPGCRHADPDLLHLRQEGHGGQGTARCAEPLRARRRASPASGWKGSRSGSTDRMHQLQPTEQEEFVGQVFKVVNDKFVGHLSFIRVIAGKIQHNHNVVNLRNGQTLRVGHLLEIQGKTTSPGPRSRARATSSPSPRSRVWTSATPSPTRTTPPSCRRRSSRRPMFGLAVEPKNRGDEQKISIGLHKIADEDPTFKVTHDPQTHELVISGVSQLHLEVIRIASRPASTWRWSRNEPKIPYRETITGDGAGDHRHKKQIGRPRPVRRGPPAHLSAVARDQDAGSSARPSSPTRAASRRCARCHYDPAINFAFIDHIVGGTIPNQFIPAVEKGCKEVLERGALAGYRIQDMRRRGLLRQVPRRR